MKFTSAIVPLVRDNIDTDQIIPARYLKATTRTGLGDHLFADWRADAQFVLNQKEFAGRAVLLAGDNFGCGSSREHAPWALTSWGFKAIIATSFADIFRNNSLKNKLIPIVLPADKHAQLVAAVEKDPTAQVSVDLAAAEITLPGGDRVKFPIDPFAQKMLLAGTDELGYLLALSGKIDAFEKANG